MEPHQTLDRAIASHQSQHLDEAERIYKTVLQQYPTNATALHMLGVVRFQQGRPEDAFALISQALSIENNAPEILSNRGLVLLTLGRLYDALEDLDKAVRIAPNLAQARYNRGNVLRSLGHPDAALSDYDAALAVQAIYPEALLNRGVVLRTLNRPDAALECFDQVLSIMPPSPEALNNRGAALKDLGRTAEAIQSYSAALGLQASYHEALYNRAIGRSELDKDYLGAIEDLERLVSLCPNFRDALGTLLHLRMHVADWRGFDSLVAQIEDSIAAGRPVIPPFAYQAISQSPAALQRCACVHAQSAFPSSRPISRRTERAREKLRIGYLSGEFGAHATAYLTAGLFEAHDRDEFEIYAFDNSLDDGSPIRARLKSAFDCVMPVVHLSDREAAIAIANHDIDILVNLNGYFGRRRMGVFALRPAPIQVNYLGFPGTLGAEYIDYILADAHVIPLGEEQFYTEKVVRLPDSYQVNDIHRASPGESPTRRQCGLPVSAFVFCWFNQAYKLTPEMFSRWMRVLRETDNSLLWLLEDNPLFATNLSEQAVRHGVAAERLVFAPMLPLAKHLARLRLADLALDSLPYNGHTSASDALWSGLPVLTCCGSTFPGRVASSLLNALDLPELITTNLADFERTAIELAGDKTRLATLRGKLAHNRTHAPLFDTTRTCRHLETAFRQMMQIHRSGHSPRGFDVEPLTHMHS